MPSRPGPTLHGAGRGGVRQSGQPVPPDSPMTTAAGPPPATPADAHQRAPYPPNQLATGPGCSQPRRSRTARGKLPIHLVSRPLTGRLPRGLSRVSRTFYRCPSTQPPYPISSDSWSGLGDGLLPVRTRPCHRPGSRLRGDLKHRSGGMSRGDVPVVPSGPRSPLQAPPIERLATGPKATVETTQPALSADPKHTFVDCLHRTPANSSTGAC